MENKLQKIYPEGYNSAITIDSARIQFIIFNP